MNRSVLRVNPLSERTRTGAKLAKAPEPTTYEPFHAFSLLDQRRLPTAAELDKVNINRRMRRPWARKCYFWKPNWIPTERQHLYLEHLYSSFSTRLAASVERELASHTMAPSAAANKVLGDRMLEQESSLLAAFTHVVPVETDGAHFNVHFVAHRLDEKKSVDRKKSGNDDNGKIRSSTTDAAVASVNVAPSYAISVFLEEVPVDLPSANVSDSQTTSSVSRSPSFSSSATYAAVIPDAVSVTEDSRTAPSSVSSTSAISKSPKDRSVSSISQGAMELFASELVASQSIAKKLSHDQTSAPSVAPAELPEMEMPQAPVANAVPLLSLMFPINLVSLSEPEQDLDLSPSVSVQAPTNLLISTSLSFEQFPSTNVPVPAAETSSHTSFASTTAQGTEKSEMTYFFQSRRAGLMPLIHDPLTPDPDKS